MISADLHTHSRASDGQYTPAELVQLAHDREIPLLALTDHDTIDGLAEAEAAGQTLGVRVLRGIELSAREYSVFHILGYGFDADAPGLKELCQQMKASRDDRKYQILDYLRDNGMSLSLEEVEAFSGGTIIGRPHFARAMVQHGWVSSVREAFDRYLDTPAYRARVKRYKPPVDRCLTVIHEAGGRVSLAHPYQIGLSDTALEALVASLAERGLDAMECWYPKHTKEQTEFYLRLADRYRLHVTGGSDFHGELVKPDVRLTAWPLELDWLFS